MEDPPAAVEAGSPHGHTSAVMGDEPWLEVERRELGGAIAMVASGFAGSVVLCGLHSPEALVAALAATAARAGVALRTERVEAGDTDIVVGRR